MSNLYGNVTLYKISEPSIPVPPASAALWPSIPNPFVKVDKINDTGYENGSLVKGVEHIPKEVYDYINQIKIDNICDFLKRKGISFNKLTSGDGKYFIIDKSLADIFKEAGVDSSKIDYEQYDDWYMTGLTKSDGTICYSMIKVREPIIILLIVYLT